MMSMFLTSVTGERQANINIADGRKSSVILASEAAKMDQVNRAQGLLLDTSLFRCTLVRFNFP